MNLFLARSLALYHLTCILPASLSFAFVIPLAGTLTLKVRGTSSSGHGDDRRAGGEAMEEMSEK